MKPIINLSRLREKLKNFFLNLLPARTLFAEKRERERTLVKNSQAKQHFLFSYHRLEKRNFIIIALTVFVLAIIVFLAVNLHLKSDEEIVVQFNQHQLLHVQTIAASVEVGLAARTQGLKVLSTFKAVQNFDLSVVENNFHEMLSNIKSKGVESISLYDSNGVIATSTNRKAIGCAYKESSGFQWAQKPENKHKTYLAGPIHPYDTPPDTSSKKSFSVNNQPCRFQLIVPVYREVRESVPLKEDKGMPTVSLAGKQQVTGKFLGIVTYTLNITELITQAPGTQAVQTNNELWIMDTSGTLLYQSKHPEMITQNIKQRLEECRACHETFDYADEMLKQREGTSLYQIKEQPKKVAAYARMEYANASWVIVLNVPRDRITAFAARSLIETLLLLGTVAIAFVGGSTLLYRNYRLKVRAEEEAKQWREKQELEKRIQKSKERHTTVIKNIFKFIPEGILVFTDKLNLFNKNKTFDDIVQTYASKLEYTEDELREIIIREAKKRLAGETSTTIKIEKKKEQLVLEFDFARIIFAEEEEEEEARIVISLKDITERKRAEVALKHSGEFFKTVFNSTNDAISIIDVHDFKIVGVNRAFLEKLGLKEEEVIGKTCYAITHHRTDPCTPPNDVCPLMDTVNTGDHSVAQHVHYAKSGEKIYAEVSTSPIKDENGRVIQVVHVVRDITERVRFEKELVKSKSYTESIIKNFLDTLIVVDTEARIKTVNPETCSLLGYTEQELVGQPVRNIFAEEEEEEEEVKALFQFFRHRDKSSLVARMEIRNMSLTYVTKDGRKIPMSFNASLLTDDQGNITGVVAGAKDITDIKRAEEELIKLNHAIEQSFVSVIITDQEGNIEYANPFFLKLTGYTLEEVIGKTPRILKSGYHNKEFYENLWDTLLSGKEWRGEMLDKKKNGELYWVNEVISPIVNKNGDITHFVAIEEDITEKKKNIQELIEAKEKAEEMSRLKSSFLANMSHELRTPMIGILGYTEFLKDETDISEIKMIADTIHSSGKRLMNTLNLILDLSSIEANKYKTNISQVNIADIALESVKLFKSFADSKNLTLEVNIKDKTAAAKVDEGLALQIINNLVNNAIKFTQRGGVTVEVDKEQINKKHFVTVKVIDTGIGISKENQEIIFDEFRQASEGMSRDYQGTGLGLTISKKFTELMGGEILVESELGKGTIFTVRFPSSITDQKGE